MSGFWLRPRGANLAAFLACVGLMLYALYAQYVLKLQPCPLCIFQRIAVIVVGVFFLLAALHDPGRVGRRIYAVLQVLPALAGIGVAARHIWIQAQPPGTVASCGASLDYLVTILPISEVISKVLSGSGECAQITWRFLGLSMPWWVLMSLAALAAWAIGWNAGRAGEREFGKS